MIPVFKPSYDEEELRALREPFSTGWVGLGPKTREFENRFAEFIGAKHAVGVNSATAGLHLALKVMDVEGGEVITTPLTFVSTNMAILYNGAVPVFADIERDTLNIDVGEIEKRITKKTRAVVVMHYGGHACDMDPIMELARDRGIRAIEDAAHACGGQYKGRMLGSIGDIGCFSFHAVKNLATGDGGMITLDNEEHDSRLRKLRWMGISKDTWNRSEIDDKYSWSYTVEEIGYKCHMNDITASIGLVQLRKLERLNARRREIVKIYNENFAGLGWFETPVEREYAKSACHNYVAKVKDRDRFIQYLQENGISSSVHYFPNHLYELFKDYRRCLPTAESVWKSIVTLPLYPDMSQRDIDKVIETVKNFPA
ncbi:MAG: DegT/DnrJ/EryC1/StrS family aminotransferase [Deltaproteobacteria bacterium]|nr:DegT/DnrJ/EryC1/StrS family aminotransferase [Deltaproteobacteria bacterium]